MIVRTPYHRFQHRKVEFINNTKISIIPYFFLILWMLLERGKENIPHENDKKINL